MPGLVELYEYKVDDLLAGRTPRGGKYALSDLRRGLLSAELSPLLKRRFTVSDRRYRDWRARQQAGAEVQGAASPFVWTPNAQADDTSAIGFQLRTLAWHTRVVERLGKMTHDLRYEPQRPTLRVLYAVTENAERQQRGVTTRFAVPVADDPLVSLGNKDVVQDITKTLSDLWLTPEGRQLVMTTLADVRENPFPQAPAEVALREHLAAAERESMSMRAREELVAALRSQLPQAPAPHERPTIREAAGRLQRLLEEQLSTLPDPQNLPKILFAPSVHALENPDDRSSELMIYLAGPQQETQWRGVTIRWQAAGPNWQLQLDKQLLMLYPHLSAAERRNKLAGASPQIEVFYEGAYVLLKMSGQAPHNLGTLAAQARAVALLLSPSEAYANLRLARAAAQEMRGAPLNLSALTPESAEKFSLAAPNELQNFVRQGLSTLLARTEHLSPQEMRRALSRCAEALHMPVSRVDQLHQALHNSLHDGDDISPLALPSVFGGTRLLSTGGHFQSFLMPTEPLSIGIKDRMVTLRWDYKGDLAVLIPGYPTLQINDLLVVALNDVDLMFVRQGEQVGMAAALRQPSYADTVGL